MNITYYQGDNLYINLTNRCTAACDFCLRQNFDSVGDADSLWMAEEPTKEAILTDILTKAWQEAPEVVFCGFGEPFLRLDDLLWVANALKQRHKAVVIRVNTNGHGNLMYGMDITPKLAGLVDILSISLNFPDAAAYEAHCHPEFGLAAYEGLLDFAACAIKQVPTVIMTVVDVLSPKDIEACGKIAANIGAAFRVRHEIT